MEAAFCVETLEDALAHHDKPDIFNTDQSSQFTGVAFTGVLADNGITISMNGKGAWRDNVFVERLWRSVKYEEVYLRAYDSVSEARASIGQDLPRPPVTLSALNASQMGRRPRFCLLEGRRRKSVQTTGGRPSVLIRSRASPQGDRRPDYRFRRHTRCFLTGRPSTLAIWARAFEVWALSQT
jgi:transposase InsO family protein